jgi:NAD(P)-dependent dehydrogenase (short-subunit alcohol dehydrogenase family)
MCDINVQGLQSTLEDVRKCTATAQGTKFEVYDCDVSDSSTVSRVFAKIAEDFGRIDYAVNCAGITTNNKPSTECSIEDFDRINAVNMRGVWLSSREELKVMKTQPLNLGINNEIPEYRAQRGAIVNIASGSAIVAVPNSPAYAAAKAGVVSLTRVDALDYSPHRIRVNAILPGLVDTPMMNQVPGQRDMVMQMALPMVPMKRLSMSEEIADAALFLCSWKASSVQGSSMVVDGGYTII